MAIKNADGLTDQQIIQGIQNGGKLVVFKYAVSIVIMTFNPNTDVHYIRPGESTIKFSIGYTLLTLVMGWWGFPWGPIYTIGSLYHNLSGGKDVTNELLSQMPPSNPNASGNTGSSSYNVPGSQSNTSSNTYNVPGNNASTNQGSSPYNIR